MQPAFGTNHVKNIGGQVKYSPEPVAHADSPEAFEKVPPAKKKPAKKATSKKTKARR